MKVIRVTCTDFVIPVETLLAPHTFLLFSSLLKVLITMWALRIFIAIFVVFVVIGIIIIIIIFFLFYLLSLLELDDFWVRFPFCDLLVTAVCLQYFPAVFSGCFSVHFSSFLAVFVFLVIRSPSKQNLCWGVGNLEQEWCQMANKQY
jgi:hypothetical protein